MVNPKPPCAVVGCEQSARMKGYCHRHYRRWKNTGDPGPAERLRQRYERAQCSILGCDREIAARGWCRNHYRRWLKYGDPGQAEPLRKTWVRYPCSANGCINEGRVRGLCGTHYARWRKHGDPEVGGLPEPQGFVNDTGYRMISIDGLYQVPEHRLVMERVLGRPLYPDETIHHKNGDRLDNRPENLEVWSSRHPPGQRAMDLVEWAVETLKRYAPDKLA